jgi:hypothetical protein|tara:strand:- start:8 stop:370 length:363 start_codon:yes stop_codon:yes gene_type:complete
LAVRYVIDKDLHIVFVWGEGTATNDDLNTIYRRLVADADFDPSFGELIDASGVERMRINAAGIRAYLEIWPFDGGRRVAFFGPQDYAYGVGRMAQMIGDLEEQFKVFRDRDAAQAWLTRT